MSINEVAIVGVVLPANLVPWIVSIKEESYSGGPHVTVTFINGYGASIINNMYSHGVELAVLDGVGELTYDTPVTSDVIGHLCPDELLLVLEQIAKLPDAPPVWKEITE